MLTEKKWPPDAVLRLLALIFLCLGAGMIIMALIPFAVRHLGWQVAPRTLALVVGTVAFHGGALVAVWIFLRQTNHRFADAFGLRNGPWTRVIWLGVAALAVVLPLAWMLSQASAGFFKLFSYDAPQQEAVQLLQSVESPWLKVYLCVFAVGFAPLVEEVLFRGIFYPAIKQLGYPRAALWGTAVVFGAIHLNLMTFLPLVLLAIVLTKLYEATNNLLTSILAHSLFNGVNVALLLFAQRYPDLLPPP
ncbi:MAG: CPBP family intramembrane metalloprotease [Verrucomicrobia bacterium]|nr:CPBP family intramembrane metalloprotease [Verrucomicrobiota bacterium]